MKAFHETPTMRSLVDQRQNAQERLLALFLNSLGRFLLNWGDDYVEKAFAAHALPDLQAPDLTDMLYRYFLDNIVTAYEIEKHGPTYKRLARALPSGNLPRSMPELESLFTDQRAMKNIFNRAGVLSRGLKTAYLRRLKNRFAEIMPAILENRISPSEAQAHIRTAWGASAARARTIFRTESTGYFAKTQIAYYKDSPRIIGFLFHSIRDAARTEICRARHGLIYRPNTVLLRKNTCPLHFNCRSEFIPLADTEANRRMLADPARDPEKVAVPPPQFKK